MRSRVAAWMFALGAVSAMAGCGKSEGTAGQPIPKAELPGKVANLLCDSMATCCKNSGFTVSTADCKSYYVQQLGESLNENDPSRVVYDAQAAGDCLAAVSGKIQCGEVDEDDAPACERIFRGTVAAGQPCNESQECAFIGGERASCESPDGIAQAVCTARSSGSSTPAARGKLGEACIGTCEEGECDFGVVAPAPGPGVPVPQPDPVICYRDDGLFCNAGTCASLVNLNGPCSDYAACQGTAFCDFNVQLCLAPRPNGETCQSSNECQSGHCQYPTDGPTDPSLPSTPAVCASRQAVTAEECANDFMDEPPQAAGDPGDPAPQPAP